MEILTIAALLGLIPAFIAQSKGRSFTGWWLYGFLLFIIAIIHSLIIPEENHNKDDSEHLDDTRDCPYCAEPIKRQASKCKHCGSEVAPIPVDESSTEIVGVSEGGAKWGRLAIVIAVTAAICLYFNYN